MNLINWMFDKRMQLTIEALAVLVHHQTKSEEPLRSRRIFLEARIPFRYLDSSLQQLVHAGILEGIRGPRGGYRLSPRWQSVSLGEVFAVVNGGKRPLDPPVNPALSNLLTQLNDRLLEELETIHLGDLI